MQLTADLTEKPDAQIEPSHGGENPAHTERMVTIALSEATGAMAEAANGTELTGDTEMIGLITGSRLSSNGNAHLVRNVRPEQLRNGTEKMIADHCVPLGLELIAGEDLYYFPDHTIEAPHVSTLGNSVEQFFGSGARLNVLQKGEQLIFKISFPQREPNDTAALKHRDQMVDGIMMSNKRFKASGSVVSSAVFRLYKHNPKAENPAHRYTHINPRYVEDRSSVPPDNAKLDHFLALICAHKLHYALLELTTGASKPTPDATSKNT